MASSGPPPYKQALTLGWKVASLGQGKHKANILSVYFSS